MKNIILIALLLCIGISMNAQIKLSKSFGEGNAVNDTLTNAGTLTFTWGEVINAYGSLHAGVTSDSLTGNTAATINYEVAFVEAPTADQWHTIATDVINGVSDDDEYEDTDFTALRFRIRIVGTGTQSTEVTPSVVFKRKN
jgi:hypothetical protein